MKSGKWICCSYVEVLRVTSKFSSILLAGNIGEAVEGACALWIEVKCWD